MFYRRTGEDGDDDNEEYFKKNYEQVKKESRCLRNVALRIKFGRKNIYISKILPVSQRKKFSWKKTSQSTKVSKKIRVKIQRGKNSTNPRIDIGFDNSQSFPPNFCEKVMNSNFRPTLQPSQSLNPQTPTFPITPSLEIYFIFLDSCSLNLILQWVLSSLGKVEFLWETL